MNYEHSYQTRWLRLPRFEIRLGVFWAGIKVQRVAFLLAHDNLYRMFIVYIEEVYLFMEKYVSCNRE